MSYVIRQLAKGRRVLTDADHAVACKLVAAGLADCRDGLYKLNEVGMPLAGVDGLIDFLIAARYHQ